MERIKQWYDFLSNIDNHVDAIGHLNVEDYTSFVVMIYNGRPLFYETLDNIDDDLMKLYTILRREHERS